MRAVALVDRRAGAGTVVVHGGVDDFRTEPRIGHPESGLPPRRRRDAGDLAARCAGATAERGLAHLPGLVVHRAAGAVVRSDLGMAGQARPRSHQAHEIGVGIAVWWPELPAAGLGRATGRRDRRNGQRMVAGARLPTAGTG